MIRHWFCRHRHRYLERRAALMLVCESCGDAVPAIDRTGERLEAREFTAPAVRRSNVVPMRRRRA